MATEEQTRQLSDLANRRRAASEARKRQTAAPPPTIEEPVIEENPAPVETDPTPNGSGMTRAERAEKRKAMALPRRDLSRELDQRDMVMPKLKISQAMSAVNTAHATSGGSTGVQQGNWYVSTSGKNLGKTVYIVPIDMRKSRSLFVTGHGVMCRSFDMVQGEGDPGGLCEGTEEQMYERTEKDRGCPLRLWQRDEETGRNIPPKCGVSYNYPVLILDPEDMQGGRTQPALLSLRSTAAATAKQINTIVTEGNLADPVWHEVILKLTVEPKSNTRGTFFVPTVEYVDATEEGSPTDQQAQKMAKSITQSVMRASIERDDTE
jgi:hypothetical protein